MDHGLGLIVNNITGYGKTGVSKFTTVEVRKSRAISFLTARSELLVCSQTGD